MLNWSEIIEGFQMPSVHEGYLCFEKSKIKLKPLMCFILSVFYYVAYSIVIIHIPIYFYIGSTFIDWKSFVIFLF